MTAFFQSSGDLLADRRFLYGRDCAANADLGSAIDLFEQTIERAPAYAPAWFELGKVRMLAGRTGAVAAFEKAVQLDPEDRLGAGLFLSQIDSHITPADMPPAFISALFDQYAEGFDEHLTNALHYSGPDALFGHIAALCHAVGRPMEFNSAFDLGCGTGLAGQRFENCCAAIHGCDLSPAMIAQAQAKRIYASLAVCDAAAFLQSRRHPADLILAADVFPYVGDLTPVMRLARRALSPTGLFSFTLQHHDGAGDVILGSDMRYAHSVSHVEALAAQHGFSVASLEHASMRQDRGEAVPGLIVTLTGL